MNRKQFLQQLEQGLSGLKPETVREILSDYEEYFNDAAAAGRSEASVVDALGNPQKLARELKAQSHYKAWEQRPTVGNLGRVVVSIAGLGLLNFILFIPFMVYLSFLTAGYMVSVSFLVAGLAVVVAWGSHSLFGWPHMSGVLHEGSVGISTAADPGAYIKNGKWQLDLDDGDQVKLVSKAGEPVLLSKQDDTLKVDASSPAAKALVKVAEDGSVSVDAAAVASVDVDGGNGDKLSWETGKDAKRFSAKSGGSEVNISASGGKGEVMLKDGTDVLKIANGHLTAHSGNDSLDVNVIPGLGMHGTLAVVGIGLLLAGALGLVFCVWLTRLSWRALVAYVRYQIDLVAGNK